MSELQARPGQRLIDHLVHVATRAGTFADPFDSGAWGTLAGLWHDLGKCQDRFQRRLSGSTEQVDHARVGAVYAKRLDQRKGLPLAFVIAGHHTGLANLESSDGASRTPLKRRLHDGIDDSALAALSQTGILSRSLPDWPPWLNLADTASGHRSLRRFEFWTRMLFSCLVDADYLDAEEAADPDKPGARGFGRPVAELRARLDAHLAELTANLPPGMKDSRVNRARRSVLAECRRAAASVPGFFSLTAPTGSGKTLASAAFALAHAQLHGMRRVIVVLPYTSIIEQNAEVYRQALGRDSVLEHHSNLDPQQERARVGDDYAPSHVLATENWDAPVIVTTTVQFLESLFSDRPSRCRKLHNVARSVVILDEVQCLPPGLLAPILEALTELTECFNCTVVLSTATPPALASRPGWPHGLSGVREILSHPEAFAAELRRVRFSWPQGSEPADWDALAADMARERQFLAIVHRRADARLLAGKVALLRPDEPVFHLSALMCPAHRSETISAIRARLRNCEPCAVVSTQLVEAGVDLDFPVVYRALGGLDSVVQAAGRCNREGKADFGEVRIFRAPTEPPPGAPGKGLRVSEAMLEAAGGSLSPDDPSVSIDYFRRFYFVSHPDVKQIQRERSSLNFETVGREFKLIEDGHTEDVVTPWGDGVTQVSNIRANGPTREAMRQLQPYVVKIYRQQFQSLQKVGALEELQPGLQVYVLSPLYRHLYSDWGLQLDDQICADPRDLVV